MPKITKVTHCAPETGGNASLKAYVLNLEKTINHLIYNIHNTTETVLAARKLQIEGGLGLSVSPSVPQDLSVDRSWLISLDNQSLVNFIKALSVTDYDEDIDGLKNYSNTTFYLQHHYTPKSTKVFLNGVRQTPGIENDYKEMGSNIIDFNFPLLPNDELTVDYIIK